MLLLQWTFFKQSTILNQNFSSYQVCYS